MGDAVEIPEGAMLVNDGSRSLLISRDGVSVLPGFIGEAVSPDGRSVIATREMRLATGISYNPDLYLIDVPIGTRTIIGRSGPTEEFGAPMAWSPDGTRIAYRFVRYPVDPHVEHPGRRARLSLCVMTVATGTERCLGGLGQVFEFDWSPDGRELATTGPGPEPLRIVDATTGAISVSISLDAPAVREALDGAGLGSAVQFTTLAFSPGGEHVAVWANVVPGGSVPLVLTRAGRVVATGEATMHTPTMLAWSAPERLIYSPGAPLEHRARLKFCEIDVAEGTERMIYATNPLPQVIDAELSPSGGWLVLLRWRSPQRQELEFLSLGGTGETRVLQLDALEIMDWVPISD